MDFTLCRNRRIDLFINLLVVLIIFLFIDASWVFGVVNDNIE